MPTALRRFAGRALAAFSRLDSLFALRSEYPRDKRAGRARLEMTPLEERVVPDGGLQHITLAWVADGAEPGTAGAVRLTRTADPGVVDSTAQTVRFHVGGSATAGADFTLSGASVSAPMSGQEVTATFLAGQSTIDVSVLVTNDAEAEGWESVTVHLDPPDLVNQGTGSPYEVGTTEPVTVWVADDELWLEADADPVLKGREVTFWLPEDGPEYTTVEWDADFDGMTFEPVAGATGWWFATTFATTGSRNVAARATPVGGTSQIVTLGITVENPPPELTIPADTTALVGVPKALVAVATAEGGIASVEWSFSYFDDDYEWNFDTDPTLTTLTPTYTFAHAGDYDVKVKVTDYDGKSSEGWFRVAVGNVAPTAVVEVSGPIREGEVATFTVLVLDPDAADIVTAYANWGEPGANAFDQINEGDYTVNADGSVSFTHRYLDVPDVGNTFAATIRLEDEWGLLTDYPVAVTVNNVAPNFVFSAGWQAADLETDWVELWTLTDGQKLTFTKVADMMAGTNPHEDTEYEFHWVIDGAAEVKTKTPWLAMPDYTRGKVHTVRAWVTDNGETAEGTHLPVKVLVDGPQDNAEVMWGGARSHAIYGTFTLDETPVPDDFSPYTNSSIRKKDWPNDDTATVRFNIDPTSAALAEALGYEITYYARADLYHTEQYSIGNDSYDLLASTYYENSTGVFAIAAPGHDDREMMVHGWAYFRHNGQIVKGVQSYFGTEEAGGLRVTLVTHKTPTTWSQTVDLYRMLRDLGSQLADKGEALVTAFAANEGRVLNVLLEGFTKGVGQFVTDLVPSENPDGSINPGALVDALFKWVLGNEGAALKTDFETANWTDADTVKRFLLQYSGLTVEKVMDVVRQQLGAGNLAALERVAGWFTDGNGNPITSVQALIEKVKTDEGGDLALDPTELLNKLKGAFEKKVKEAMAKLGAQVAAKFVPGAGALLSVYNGASWVIANKDQLAGLFSQFLSVIDDLNPNNFLGGDEEALRNAAIATVKGKVRAGLQDALPVLLGALAGQFGLGTLPNELRRAVGFVPLEVDKALRAVVAKVAAKVTGASTAAATTPGGTSGGLFDGRISAAKQFVYRDTTTYVLWVAQDKTGISVKLAKKVGNGYEFVDVVTVQGLMGNRADAQLNALLAAARELTQKTKVSPHSTNKPTPAALLALSRKVEEAEAKVVQAIQAHAFGKLASNCFAAGTKILTRAGWKNVEDIRPGEEVLARPELDPAAAAEWKAVEERFERFGPVLHLHFPGGELIRTTLEHPFWVQGKGWTPAGALSEGDRIATLSGEWVPVADVYDTGEWEAVYNLRVADHHTYFVGDDGWGWAAWAHNTYDATIKFLSGLKVVEGVKSYPAAANRLATNEETAILQAIRTRGKYGAMGDQEALSGLLAYELWFEGETAPGYIADVPGVLTQYFSLPTIEKYRADEEKIIADFHKGAKHSSVAQVTAQPTGGPIKDRPLTGWTAYLHATWTKTLNGVVRTAKEDSDARGEKYADMRRALKSDLHGHHIVFKEAANGGGGKAEAAEARDILLYYGINPYWDKENLVYAKVGSGHSIAHITTIRDELKTAFLNGRSRGEIVIILKDLGTRYVQGRL